MNEPGEFNYDVPSPETLAGINLSFGDPDQFTLEYAPTEQAAAQGQISETGRPRRQDLVGITLTFGDSPNDCRLHERPPQSPPSQPEQSPPGS